jgi:hypothetical protein
VLSGGLASWDGAAWALLGGAAVAGDVTALLADGDTLYVAGHFSRVGTLRAQGLAALDGATGAWRELGGGVSGGTIFCLATLHSDLYVGGSFSRAGGASTGGIAKWDGRRWAALGGADGDVRALVVVGEFIFAGGDFGAIGGVPAHNVARLHSGKWAAVGRGLNGAVLAMRAVQGCVYMGGAFTDTAAAGDDLRLPVRHVTRWCIEGEDALAAGDGPRLADFDSFPALGPVRAILQFEPAAVPAHSPAPAPAAPAGNCSAAGDGACPVLT